MQTVEHLSRETGERKLLFLLNSLAVGGSERKAVALANALSARGWDVRFAYVDAPARSGEDLLCSLSPHVPVFCLGRRSKYSIPGMLRLNRALRREGITTLIAVNLHPLLYAVPATFALGRRRPQLVALVNMMFTQQLRRGVMPFYVRLLRAADQVVYGSRAQMASWLESMPYATTESRCIYNGIALDRFMLRSERRSNLEGFDGVGAGGIVVGTVAQLRPEKNLRELIRAVANLVRKGQAVELVIVGDGPERDALEALVRAEEIGDRVVFAGQTADVYSYLREMDVFVLPSTYETFSNAALEAMASGVPVVLSRVGGSVEMVTHGVEGFLYTPGVTEDLVQALSTLLRDPELRREMGRRARDRVERDFSWDRMVDEYECLFSPESRFRVEPPMRGAARNARPTIRPTSATWRR